MADMEPIPNSRRLLGAFALAAGLATSALAAPPPPDFGPNVHILSPDAPGLQQRVEGIYEAQQPNHFGPRRDAILLLPGTYRDLRSLPERCCSPASAPGRQRASDSYAVSGRSTRQPR